MTISFNAVNANLRVPGFYPEMDNSAANTMQASGPALLIGHALPDAKMTLNSPMMMPSAEMMQQLVGRSGQPVAPHGCKRIAGLMLLVNCLLLPYLKRRALKQKGRLR